MADDETDLKELEATVRAIGKEGLVWAASKLVPVGFGIKKLQINLVVEDEKVSIDELQAQIEEDEEHVQSTDVVSFPRNQPALRSYGGNPSDHVFSSSTGCHAEVVSYITTFVAV